MRNVESWRPTKYVRRRGRLRASTNVGEVSVASRLIADLVASRYDHYLPRYARGRLLDLGCGKVPLFETYRSLVDEVVCIDWSASLHGQQYVDHECDISDPLPLKDSSIDTIILSDVLEHVPEPAGLWDELHRVLAPEGYVLLNVPFLYWVHEEPHDYFRYTEFALRRLAENSGFGVVLLEPVGGPAAVFADLLAKNLERLPLLGNPAAAAVQGVTQLLCSTAIGQKLTRRGVHKMPSGYFLVAQKRFQVVSRPFTGLR